MSALIKFLDFGVEDAPERWTLAEALAFEGDGCEAMSGGSIGYVCTGPEGHDGPHFADGIGRCLAMWRDDQ